MEKIIAYIEQEKPKSCAVIGGGFIGVELAENFTHLGLKTALIERNERVMNIMDVEISDVLNKEMKDNGVDLYFNDAIERIEGKKLIMKNGVNIDVDFIAASLGIIPDTKLAIDAGLSIGPTNGIVVNRIYANRRSRYLCHWGRRRMYGLVYGQTEKSPTCLARTSPIVYCFSAI